MGILIAVLAISIGIWVYQILDDELRRQRWKEAERDRAHWSRINDDQAM